MSNHLGATTTLVVSFKQKIKYFYLRQLWKSLLFLELVTWVALLHLFFDQTYIFISMQCY